MIDFGKRPCNPIAPSTTMKIGASAKIGTICEQMIHGKRLRSSTRLCTIRSASAIPSNAPRAKPSAVADSVTSE